MRLKDYITEYVSSGRGAYRSGAVVNGRLEELNKFMNNDPLGLEACIAKIGRYHLFEFGYIPHPWIFYFNNSHCDDNEVEYYNIGMRNTDGRIWVCDGDNPIGNDMRLEGMGKFEPIYTMDPSEIQINMTINDTFEDYAKDKFLEPEDEISSVWKDAVVYSIMGSYGAGNIKKEKDCSMTISLDDFDGVKMIKAFETVNNKKFWEKLVIK
jgi:hypothetical protein